MPPNPPNKAHGFAMRSMSLRDMQISKSKKKNSWPPPLPNPGDAPVYGLKIWGLSCKRLKILRKKAHTYHILPRYLKI